MPDTIERWDYFELELIAESSGNPFLDVTLDAEFVHGNRSIKVSGFYDGGDTFRVRFMPDMEGAWDYVTHSNLPELDGKNGEILCTPPTGDNHGPVRVVDSYHFAYEDGTPYHPVGTTCYVWNHQGDELEAQTIATLWGAPFNKMRMCVFPKRYRFNTNEPPLYPFEGEVKRQWDDSLLDSHRTQPPLDFWDFDRFNPEYFRKLEKHILDLRDLGIEADLIIFHPYDFGAWGFDQMPAEVNDRYLRYLTARVSAFRNVWWSFANEFDFMRHLDLNDWDHFFKIVQANDPYHHLRSIHNGHVFYDHTKPWVTHCSIQSGEFQKMPQWLLQYKKPVVVDECGYEGDIERAWGSLSAEALVECFWLGFACGGYVGHGETYVNEEEVLWWSKGGTLQGESPARIAFLREIIEDMPPPGLSPFAPREERHTVIPDGVYKGMAAGHNGEDYYLLYLARNQPRFRRFKLPEGNSYQIDIIDTWNMTIDRFADAASGHVEVELPRKKYLALRIVRNR
jgi:hypothetical protein